VSTFDDNFEKALVAAGGKPSPFKVGDRVRTRSGYTGVVSNVRKPAFSDWHASVNVDGGGSWDGAQSELLPERKKGDKISVKVSKKTDRMWKSVLSDRSVGYATWSWAKTKVKPEHARIVVTGWATMHTKRSEAIEQIFTTDKASEKAAKAFAHELVQSGQAVTAEVSYQVYAWYHLGSTNEQRWQEVEAIEYEASE
jgi:hypothetical protein